jgi:hypothetical protein
MIGVSAGPRMVRSSRTPRASPIRTPPSGQFGLRFQYVVPRSGGGPTVTLKHKLRACRATGDRAAGDRSIDPRACRRVGEPCACRAIGDRAAKPRTFVMRARQHAHVERQAIERQAIERQAIDRPPSMALRAVGKARGRPRPAKGRGMCPPRSQMHISGLAHGPAFGPPSMAL